MLLPVNIKIIDLHNTYVLCLTLLKRKRLNSSCKLDGQTSSTNSFLSQNWFRRTYEEIDEGVVVHALSSGNELIRFTRPMRRMSRGDEKRDGTAGQKLTMLRK
jgi:hypothetical protein